MILPAGAAPQARLLLFGRGLRALVDGYVAVLLPAYLLALGFGTWEVGVLSTATLLGSALATLMVGAWGHRFRHRRLARGATGGLRAAEDRLRPGAAGGISPDKNRALTGEPGCLR